MILSETCLLSYYLLAHIYVNLYSASLLCARLVKSVKSSQILKFSSAPASLSFLRLYVHLEWSRCQAYGIRMLHGSLQAGGDTDFCAFS